MILGTESCDEGGANGSPPSCCSATCQPEPGGTPATTATLCTANDTCDGANACVGGAPPSCDDGNPCTADSCVVVDRAASHDAAARDGFACDDGVPVQHG